MADLQNTRIVYELERDDTRYALAVTDVPERPEPPSANGRMIAMLGGSQPPAPKTLPAEPGLFVLLEQQRDLVGDPFWNLARDGGKAVQGLCGEFCRLFVDRSLTHERKALEEVSDV